MDDRGQGLREHAVQRTRGARPGQREAAACRGSKWERALGDINKGETITMAPLVVKDKVIVGDSGGEFGVRGWIAGLSAATGAVLWRAHHTGPDRDVLIGPSFKPFYPQD